MPPAFPNDYKRSLVKTEKDCWTCRKSTYTCLLTDNYASSGDFLYTCENHLQDRNFASAIVDDTIAVLPSKERTTPAQKDIDAAVKEYEARKKEKGKSVNSDAVDSDKPKDLDKAPEAEPMTPPIPTRYALHKQIYDMRLRIYQQKQQLKEAQARRSKLEFPTAPGNRPSA